MTAAMHTLYHAHDPMCSWCWGFKPNWQRLVKALPANITIKNIVGGLAPDSDEPMPEPMRQMLQEVWQRISHTIPGTEFNFDFWTQNTPRRSTYPACRAVLAAKAQNSDFEYAMITAIQHAYYLHAKNPSDDSVLIELAGDIGCDVNLFKQSLNSNEIADALNADFAVAQKIGANSYPSLFLEPAGKAVTPIALNYTDIAPMLDQIDNLTTS